MGKAILTFICMFLSLAFGFDSYASEHLLPLEESEYQEIVSMRDEILFQMNHGGARAELGRDVQMDELGMERAYKIYSEPGLLKTEDPKKSLENSDYMWQIPVYTGHVTVLADITKVTPLPKDIPEDAEEMLKDDLNHWTVGAVYVYKNETIGYNEAVAASLEVRDMTAINTDMRSFPDFRDPISRSSRIQCRWNPRVYHSSPESHGTCIYRRVADGGRKQEYCTIFGGTGWPQ